MGRLKQKLQIAIVKHEEYDSWSNFKISTDIKYRRGMLCLLNLLPFELRNINFWGITKSLSIGETKEEKKKSYFEFLLPLHPF